MSDQAVYEAVQALERVSKDVEHLTARAERAEAAAIMWRAAADGGEMSATRQEARAEAAEDDVRRLLAQRAAVLEFAEAHTGQHLWACACCSRIEAILRGGDPDEGDACMGGADG